MPDPTPDEAAALQRLSALLLDVSVDGHCRARVDDVVSALAQIAGVRVEAAALRRDLAAARPVLDAAVDLVRMLELPDLKAGPRAFRLVDAVGSYLAALSAPVEARPPTLAETRTGTDPADGWTVEDVIGVLAEYDKCTGAEQQRALELAVWGLAQARAREQAVLDVCDTAERIAAEMTADDLVDRGPARVRTSTIRAALGSATPQEGDNRG